MDNKKMLKILIVSENASSIQGGEAVLPLHYFRLLSIRGLKPYLVVHERVKTELDNNYPEYAKQIVYVKDIYLQKILYKLSKFFPRRISENTFMVLIQLLTSIRQKYKIKSMVKDGLVNVVHQPTPVSPKQPSLIYNVGVPVIIGPMNGGMTYPNGFIFMESKAVKFLVTIGRSTSSLVNFIFPGKRKASLLLVSNNRTLEALPSSSTNKVKLMVENGVDLSLWQNELSNDYVPEVAEFIYMGRLVDWKGVNYLLDAFSNLIKNHNAKLTIIGDGIEMSNLQKHAIKLNLTTYVDFKGFMSQSECAEFLSKSTALILPSLYECGGAVVLEAMAASKPVIAVNWGGPSDYLNSECGILITPKSPEYLVRKLEESMVLLVKEPEFAHKMGCVGRQRVEELFDWNKKIDDIIDHYLSVLS